MKAKKYLSQIRRYDNMIRQRQLEALDFKSRMESLSGVSYDKEAVMTSGTMDLIGEQVSRYYEMLDRIRLLEDEYVEKKHRIIGEIESIGDTPDGIICMELLHKRYVEYKSLELIAVEMSYTYDWTRHMHGKALDLFYKKILRDKIEENV